MFRTIQNLSGNSPIIGLTLSATGLYFLPAFRYISSGSTVGDGSAFIGESCTSMIMVKLDTEILRLEAEKENKESEGYRRRVFEQCQRPFLEKNMREESLKPDRDEGEGIDQKETETS